MKKIKSRFCFVVVVTFFLILHSHTSAQDKSSKPASVSGVVVIEDFNNGTPGPNRLGCDTGSFHAPRRGKGNDLHQKYGYENDDDWSLRLDYDLTARSGMVGYWTRLCNTELSRHVENGYLALYIKGGKLNGYASRVKVELKSNNGLNTASVMIGGITDDWQKKRIALKRFSALRSWNMYELVFVLASTDLPPGDKLKGTIFIDNIAIESK